MECCLKKRILTIGNPWPNFSIKAVGVNNEIITVDNDFIKDKIVVFFFYPLDFTFVCPTELNELTKIVEPLAHINGTLITVSTDSIFSHKEWKKQLNGINFLMGSDTSRNLSQKLGVLNEEGVCTRTTYVVDKGIVQWLEVAPEKVGRDVQYLLRNVEAIHSGGLCPASWQKGQDFINI